MSVMEMSSAPQDVVEEKQGKKKGKKKLLIVLVVVLALAAAAWWFMIRPSGATEAPKPGQVVTLDPIQVNLQGGHYLKIGIALQAVEGVEEVDGSQALDATIELFSGRTMAQLASENQRLHLKKKLSDELADRYDDQVMGVYFTDFVTQ